MDKDKVIQTHYQRLAGHYDDFLYYSPEFVRALTSKMIQKLRLKKEDVFVDLGCGTGMYSLDILKQVPLDKPVIGVDAFAEMLAKISEDSGIRTVHMDALAFSAQPGRYDKILVKETVHHIEDRAQLFRNLYQRLPDGGILLLVHVPPQLNYPLFEKALRRAEQWHADPQELNRLLQETGFEVEMDFLDYPHSIPKEVYFQMVQGCYMSVLSSFTESEIQEGLAEMRGKYADRTTLEFVDHFDYVTAVKP